MEVNDAKWDYVIELIKENKIDEVVEYVRGLNKSEYQIIEENLISELKNTNNSCIRNSIALVLSDLKCDKSINTIISLINNPEYYNCRGTLIYALHELNCQEQIVSLFNLIYEGNYETKCNMFTLIESKINLMNDKDVEFCKESLLKQIDKLRNDYELLCDMGENIFKLDLE